MTEFELMEIFSTMTSVQHAWITTYFTTLTAYLVAAYVVGEKLTLFQVSVISVGFVWFAGLCVYAGVNAGLQCARLAAEIVTINPARSFSLTTDVITAAAVVMCGGILIALIFMWQVRHSGAQ
jgi:hypothetical protein